MRSAIIAMMWEQWRLSRVEAAQRFAAGLLAGSAAMVWADSPVNAAITILAGVHAFFWFSIAKLNGGRFLDGYKPGFPLYLLYTRPLPTAVIVSVAIAYDLISCAGLYLISAAILGLVFGQPLPLWPVAMLLVTVHFAFICIQWSTRNRSAQWIGSMAATVPLLFIVKSRLNSPQEIGFAIAEYMLMVMICVVSFGLTLAGVVRQRRGDSEEKASRLEAAYGYPAWLISFFRFPCPTSSATRAQLWFELKSSGLPILTLGFLAAALIFLLFALGIPIEAVRQAAIGIPVMCVPFVLIALGGNAFGIRKRQGRTYVSAFESTQPYDAAELAGIKILVRTACMLIALTAIGMSVWTSSPLMGSWGSWNVEGNDTVRNLLQMRREVEDTLGGLTAPALAALAVIASISVALMIALLATFTALRTRYPRHVLISISVLMSCGFALVLLASAARSGVVSALLLDSVLRTTGWIAAAVLVSAAVYLLWNSFAERLLTVRYACGALVITALFGLAWLTAFRAVEGPPVMAMFLLVLVPLIVSVLAPWSLGRVRRT